MKFSNKDETLPIKYNEINIQEASTKLSNLVFFYPYNPYKERDLNMPWLEYNNLPFCGIISECHRKGFPLFSDWFEIGNNYRQRPSNSEIRRKVYEHLLKLCRSIGYKEKKDFIEINNDFKVLDCWISEMYKKLSYQDNNYGWKIAGLREIEEMEVFFEKNPGKRWSSKEVGVAFRKVFNFDNIRFTENALENLITSKEFDDLINDILRLGGKNWISCDAGKLRILGNSVEEFQERRVYKELDKFPKVLENINKAYEHKLIGEWNDVSLYCCKALENFYKNLLRDNDKNKKLSLKKLTQKIKENSRKLFKKTDSAIMIGIDNLLLSGINIVGTVRNTRDSGHGNERDVLRWEAEMGYNFTILLLRTLIKIIK